MLKRPTMKEILFPERGKIKMNFEHHQRNLRFIKDLENANKEEKKIQNLILIILIAKIITKKIKSNISK